MDALEGTQPPSWTRTVKYMCTWYTKLSHGPKVKKGLISCPPRNPHVEIISSSPKNITRLTSQRSNCSPHEWVHTQPISPLWRTWFISINMIDSDRSQVLLVSFYCRLEGRRTKPRLSLSSQTSLRQVQMRTRRCIPPPSGGGTGEVAGFTCVWCWVEGRGCSEFKFRRKQSYIGLKGTHTGDQEAQTGRQRGRILSFKTCGYGKHVG